jgi:hypothetical protein
VNVYHLTLSKVPDGGGILYLQPERGAQKIRIPSRNKFADHVIVRRGELVATDADDTDDADDVEQTRLGGFDA